MFPSLAKEGCITVPCEFSRNCCVSPLSGLPLQFLGGRRCSPEGPRNWNSWRRGPPPRVPEPRGIHRPAGPPEGRRNWNSWNRGAPLRVPEPRGIHRNSGGQRGTPTGPRTRIHRGFPRGGLPTVTHSSSWGTGTPGGQGVMGFNSIYFGKAFCTIFRCYLCVLLRVIWMLEFECCGFGGLHFWEMSCR